MPLQTYEKIHWMRSKSIDQEKLDDAAELFILKQIKEPIVIISCIDLIGSGCICNDTAFCYRRLTVNRRFIQNFNMQFIRTKIKPETTNLIVYVLQEKPVLLNGSILFTGSDAVAVIRSLFNRNSLNSLYYGKYKYDKNFLYMIKKFKEELNSIGISTNDCVVDSSAVMALYGLRRINDLDFLCLKEISAPLKSADCHDQYIKYYGKTMDSLIYNPEYYLWFEGVKFITLEVLEEFKKNRGEKKDKRDLMLISVKLNANAGIISKIKLIFAKILIFIDRQKRILRKFVGSLIKKL